MLNNKIDKKTIEICFSPKLFPYILTKNNYIIVIVDILRATTSICAAFDNNIKEIIPVAKSEDAKKYIGKGYLIAAERDGKKLDFADFGNSPFYFRKKEVKGKTIVYSTTNGTNAIECSKHYGTIVIGSFINLKALSDWLIKQNKNIVILCSGWKDKFSLEDSVFAGALAENILKNKNFNSECDSVTAALDLWLLAKNNLLEYIEKSSHRHRLKKMMLDDVLEYCFTLNSTNVIPILKGNAFIDCSKI